MDVMREANVREAQGEDVLHLEVGQPGTGAPGLRQPPRPAAPARPAAVWPPLRRWSSYLLLRWG
mgnify:CR=1 FL=1